LLSLAASSFNEGAFTDAMRFISLRLAALDPGPQRAREQAELDAVIQVARAEGVEVVSEPPSLERGSRGRVTDGPDLAAIVHFFNEAVNTPTPLDYGELVLSRLDQCTEKFFDGLDMLISYSRSRGQTARAERLTSFKDYLHWAKAEAAERGVQELRNELIWGDAVDKVQEMASGLEGREAMDQQFARLREIIGRTHGRLRVQRLAQLATLLLERYMRSELPADLDECIRVQRQAAEAKTPDNTEHAAMLANLSSALQRRFEHRTEAGERATNDLNAAIDAGRQATRLTSPGDPLYVNRLAGLATLLLHRFDQQGRPADRDEAVSALEDALACGKASGTEARTMRAILEVRQQRTRQLAFRQRLDRFLKEADQQLIVADDACDELLAALAEATVSPAARPDLRLLVDTVNFLIWRVISVPQDQAIREMAIRQPVAAFLKEIEDASDPAERERFMGRSAEVARTALTSLGELWDR
jgi:hypothetical protein